MLVIHEIKYEIIFIYRNILFFYYSIFLIIYFKFSPVLVTKFHFYLPEHPATYTGISISQYSLIRCPKLDAPARSM